MNSLIWRFLQSLVFGYVHSSYGLASINEIYNNITKYYSWYAIDGIFVDEGELLLTFFSPKKAV